MQIVDRFIYMFIIIGIIVQFPASMLTDREQLVERTRYLQNVLYEAHDPELIPPGYKTLKAACKDMIDCNDVYPNIIVGNG